MQTKGGYEFEVLISLLYLYYLSNMPHGNILFIMQMNLSRWHVMRFLVRFYPIYSLKGSSGFAASDSLFGNTVKWFVMFMVIAYLTKMVKVFCANFLQERQHQQFFELVRYFSGASFCCGSLS